VGDQLQFSPFLYKAIKQYIFIIAMYQIKFKLTKQYKKFQIFYLTSPQPICNMINITNQNRRIRRTSWESYCIIMRTNILNNSKSSSITPIPLPHGGCRSLSISCWDEPPLVLAIILKWTIHINLQFLQLRITQIVRHSKFGVSAVCTNRKLFKISLLQFVQTVEQ